MTDLLLSSAEHILGLCSEVYKMVQTAKSNKALCQQVGERVRTLEKMVLSIKQRPENATPDVKNALVDLAHSLRSATELMGKVSKANAVVSFLTSSSIESKFQEVSQKLNEDVQLLSMALQISHGEALREGLRSIAAQHRSAAAHPLAPLRRKPVLRAPLAAAEARGGREAADGGREAADGGREAADGGREAADGGREAAGPPPAAPPDPVSVVAKLLLAAKGEAKAPVAALTEGAATSAPKTEAFVPRSHDVPLRKAKAPVPEWRFRPPAFPASPAPEWRFRPPAFPASPAPASTPVLSPVTMVSAIPVSPVSMFPYPVVSPPPVPFHPMPTLYQPPAGTVTSTVFSYNQPPSQAALNLAQLHASVPPVFGNSITNISVTQTHRY